MMFPELHTTAYNNAKSVPKNVIIRRLHPVNQSVEVCPLHPQRPAYQAPRYSQECPHCPFNTGVAKISDYAGYHYAIKCACPDSQMPLFT